MKKPAARVTQPMKKRVLNLRKKDVSQPAKARRRLFTHDLDVGEAGHPEWEDHFARVLNKGLS